MPAAAGDRDAYRKHVAALLSLRSAADHAHAVVALEAQLAEGTLDPRRRRPGADRSRTTFAELVALAQQSDWAAYVDEAGLLRADVNVAEPRLLRQLDRSLRESPVAAWRSYLRFRLLEAAAPYLSRPFVDESPARDKPRGELCAETTEALLGDAVGKLYVERYFAPATGPASRPWSGASSPCSARTSPPSRGWRPRPASALSRSSPPTTRR